ncbi:hypothetical protein Xoosp14_84 [Xanthomonas phage Xoo-sp14]|nr:hypothetical protein Xoosp14_84 [Xanthomonas phage Xoo-sp14]
MSNTNPLYYALAEEGFLIRELDRYNVNDPAEADKLHEEQDGDYLAMQDNLQHFRRVIGTDNLHSRSFALDTDELILTEINDEDSDKHDLVYDGSIIDEALKRHGF